MGTFWKVAVLPCMGVLAPICSCWHNATSFSISVTTKDFSSSTSWNREIDRVRKTCLSGKHKLFMVVLSGESGLICTDIDRYTGLDLQCSSNTNHNKEKGGWNKIRFSVVWCNPSASSQVMIYCLSLLSSWVNPYISVTGAINLLQLYDTNDLKTQALFFRVAPLMTGKSTQNLN